MNFKDVYLEDIENTFFDLDEFAEKHSIDGEEYTAVVTQLSVAQSEASYKNRTNYVNPKETAISNKSFVIYLKESEFKRKVTSNALIVFDGKKIFVNDVIKKGGVVRITTRISEV